MVFDKSRAGIYHKHILEQITDKKAHVRVSSGSEQEFFVGYCCGKAKSDVPVEISVQDEDSFYRLHGTCYEFIRKQGVDQFYKKKEESKSAHKN